LSVAAEGGECGEKDEGGKVTKDRHSSLIIAEGKGEPFIRD
jgi:hypothetical protein